MVNALKNKKTKLFVILLVFLAVGVFTAWGYPHAKKSLTQYSIKYYKYRPSSQVVSKLDLSGSEAARAVPILVYHGVLRNEDQSNTTIKRFIEQLEMLKREGYTTISIRDFDAFRQGKFTLPPKPIILTFDDGRKDSFYTTDDVLKKLDMKATIFVATGRVTEGDSFFLSWKDLRRMRDSGRWEIEAHGRNSHDRVYLDKDRKEWGWFLTSRIYLPGKGRLETVEEFETRVENDYLNNLRDLRENLGIEPRYIAIPLNDYGATPVSNYPEARAYNDSVIKKYFRLAFVQANDSFDILDIAQPVYNYRNDDPYTLRRIEVKNMEPETLKNILENEFPSDPELKLSNNDPEFFRQNAYLAYGNIAVDGSGLRLSTSHKNESARVSFGDSRWHDYKVRAVIKRLQGRSVVLLAYVKNKENYVSFGITDKGVFLREMVDGVERDLASSYLYEGPRQLSDTHELTVEIKDRNLTAYMDGVLAYENIPLQVEEGAVGFKVWSSSEIASGLLSVLEIQPLLPAAEKEVKVERSAAINEKLNLENIRVTKTKPSNNVLFLTTHSKKPL